jgi:hypothetical protein
MVTMSQKSSVPQAVKSVSQALIPDSATIGREAMAFERRAMRFRACTI